MAVPTQIDFVREFALDARAQLLDEVRQLDAIIKDLTPPDLPSDAPRARDEKPAAAPKAKPKRRTGPRPSANQMAKEAAERRKKIVALLLARGEEMSPQAIKAEIPMNPGQAQADFRKLAEEGHIRRNGPQTRPTYEAIVKPPTPTLAATAEPQGRAGRTAPVLDDDGSTVGGRMLAYISATGGATRDGLIEHLGLTGEIAEQEIGKLLREGDVRYERRGGITFLVEEPNV